MEDTKPALTIRLRSAPGRERAAERDRHVVVFGCEPLSIDDVVMLSRRRARAELSAEVSFRARLTRATECLDELLVRHGSIYGVTTGYGESCTEDVPPELISALPERLYTFHGCGTGRLLDAEETRAVLTVRIASLCKGYSAVGAPLLEQMVAMLDGDVLPCIPAEGSVGASGDLTPLSYVAAAMCGEREVMFEQQRTAAREALAQIGCAPLRLRPKEALAVMNGTAVMTGLACIAYARAAHLVDLACAVSACGVIAIGGNPYHFDPMLFEIKPHPGPAGAAAKIRALLGDSRTPSNGQRLQDRYSLRCAPHVIGVLSDTLDWCRRWIEIEINSANDNPLVDADSERVLHGGNFYGGHIAQAMDSLKTAVASVADLLDRQLAILVDPRYGHALPANLSGARGEEKVIQHGLKAVQIATSAWTAEALKLTMPASSFSRSTESHNQDKVSMGTIAARDAIRILELSEQVGAAMLIAVRQAMTLRRIAPDPLAEPMRNWCERLERAIPFVAEDRALDKELLCLADSIKAGGWTL